MFSGNSVDHVRMTAPDVEPIVTPAVQVQDDNLNHGHEAQQPTEVETEFSTVCTKPEE